LKELLQNALDIGVSAQSKVEVNDILPCPTTVRRNVEENAAKGRANLLEVIKNLICSNLHFASTMDLWTEKHKKVSYMSISLHYIDENFHLHQHTLQVQ
jgi:hypothetical protein